MNHPHIQLSKVEGFAPHLGYVQRAPVCLHDPVFRMPVSSLQDMGDFVGQDVRQKGRDVFGIDHFAKAVHEHMDVNSFEGARVSQNAVTALLNSA
jgi:hypothetical protein